jgi:hypothetical protein
VRDNDFIGADISLDTFTDRHKYWTKKLDEIPALLFWFWQPLGSVVNLKFVFQEGQPATPEGRRAKRRQQAYFRTAFIYILDWVFRFTVDQDVNDGSLDRFDEWDKEVTKKLKTLKNKDAIRSCMLRIGEWPSYAAVQSNRQWMLSDVGITAALATLVGYTSGLFYGFSLRVLFTGSLFGLFTRNYCTHHSVYIYGPSCSSS